MIIFSDVDGVLTDGRYYQNANLDVMKGFSTRDFHAINQFVKNGFCFVFLTSSEDECTINKFSKFNLSLISGCKNKKDAVIETCKSKNVLPKDCIFVGDGPQDLEAMVICGKSFCPFDASQIVKNNSNIHVLNSLGGSGVIDELLYRQFKKEYEKVMLP